MICKSSVVVYVLRYVPISLELALYMTVFLSLALLAWEHYQLAPELLLNIIIYPVCFMALPCHVCTKIFLKWIKTKQPEVF